jgi:cell wall-associated NlpC family hydrolase
LLLSPNGIGWKVRMALATGLVAAIAFPATALGAGGGLTPAGTTTDKGEPATSTTPTPGSLECTTGVEGVRTCAPVTPATLVLGVAAPPETAPPAVKAAIAAANLIHTRPYIWGGGHARWWMPGYDCSGAVSFALHGAGLITTPMDSGEMMGWGVAGKGRWITIYANAGHAFAVIDGLRWDTAGDEAGTGPRWHPEMVSTAGYVARHPAGY